MNRARAAWLLLQSTLWFLPTVLVVAAVAAAVALIEAQGVVPGDLAKNYPRLIGASADGARAMLSAIATSMVTVAGVVFSITIVALTLASTQYSPRVLRNFMSDRPTQLVLGTFVAIFAYCLVVLRTIRGEGDLTFVPSLAVLGGVVMAFIGIAVLIYFVHHVATSIQVSEILLRIHDETQVVLDRLFPKTVGGAVPEDTFADGGPRIPEQWTPIPAPRTGYLVALHGDRLLELADRHDEVVCMAVAMGDFVVEGWPLLLVADRARDSPVDAESLRRCFTIERQRTIHQDAPFGLQQIVDVALKALSPSVHDPTTARACIDHLGALMMSLAGRRIPSQYRCTDGRLRVIATGPDFESMMATSFDSIVHHASTHVEVYRGLLISLERIADACGDESQRAVVGRTLDELLRRADAADLPTLSRRALLDRASRLQRTLGKNAAVRSDIGQAGEIPAEVARAGR